MPAHAGATAHKSPWLAAILSLLLPGVGQLYGRRIKRGLIFFGINLLLSLAHVWNLTTPQPWRLWVSLAGSLVSFLVRMIAVVDAFLCARRWNAQGAAPTPPVPGESAALWVVWSAFVYAMPIYALLGHLLEAQNRPAIPRGLSPSLVIGACLLWALVSGLLLVRGPLAAPNLAKQNRYETYSIIRWALAASIGIYGLLSFLLTRMWAPFLALLGCSFALLVRLMPTPAAYERYSTYQVRR